jgi:hypothetical protein
LFTQTCLGSKFRPSLLENAGVRALGGILEIFICSKSAFQVKITFLLDALQLLMLFVGSLTHLELKLSLFSHFVSVVS